MLEVDLINLAKRMQSIKSELPEAEVKAAEGGCPKIFDSLSSLANQSGGGTIIFGIDEKHDFKTCGVYNTDDLMVQITNS